MAPKVYTVQAFWDAEASVWVATSKDIPGLNVEEGTREALIETLRDVVPELLILNGLIHEPSNAPVDLIMQQKERILLHA